LLARPASAFPRRTASAESQSPQASARLLERSGLTFEGRLARYAVLPNVSAEPQDCLLFGKAIR